jgi:hypothetical protein
MILNAFAVLDAFTTLLRLALALVIVMASVRALLGRKLAEPPMETERSEERYYLLALVSFVLLFLNVAAWPLFYLMLESFIPQWPDVMCIYGVTQIGARSTSASRYLPALVRTLEITKPLLIFVGGAWFCLHLANRRTATAPLKRRVYSCVLVLGMLALTDCAVEIGYLSIPKTEETLQNGCCTLRFDVAEQAQGFLAQAGYDDHNRLPLGRLFWGINGFLLIALLISMSRWRWQYDRLVVLWLPALALVSLPVSLTYLVEVVAPAILHLPYHHCPYDLIPKAPESILAIVLYLFGLFAVGWASLTWCVGRSEETHSFLRNQVTNLLWLAFSSYLGSFVMIWLEMALA